MVTDTLKSHTLYMCTSREKGLDRNASCRGGGTHRRARRANIEPRGPDGDEEVDRSMASTLADEMSKMKLEDKAHPYSRAYSGRISIEDVLRAPVEESIGKTITVGGWVKTGREAEKGAILFIALNDGSGPENLQVVVKSNVYDLGDLKSTGTSCVIEGELREPPESAKGQTIELHATRVIACGKCDASTYPIAKKKQTLEFLREKIHLRPRTNTIASIARVRSALAYATHTFFNKNGFLYVHTPCITQSDCEGAGEMFQVTTMLAEAEKPEALESKVKPEDIEAKRAEVSERGDGIRTMKESGAEAKAVKKAVKQLDAVKSELAEMEAASRKIGGLQRTEDGSIDYTDDFFGGKSFLTVSGQLQVETYACALSNVYTFGPTFRAENSNTTRHLAEFWMIEPELAFADLQDDMQCAEDYVKFCCNYLLENCYGDLEFFAKMYDSTCIDRVKAIATTPFGRVTYTEAIELLEKAVADGKKFAYPVSWGIDLATEHERWLAEEHFQKPVIVYNYPKDIKAFYMRLNDDNKTVAAMDVLVPKVGELIGGSQREERLDVLERRMTECELVPEDYGWYMDLRRYGTVTHSGFGLGFERLILLTTGMENIRDVIPYPRWPNNCIS